MAGPDDRCEPRLHLERMRQPQMTVGPDDWKGHAYDVLVRFFSYRVYIDSNRHDTIGYEWLLARCCHLVVCFDVLMDGLEDDYVYHVGYCITLIMTSTTLLMFCFTCMLQFIGANIVTSLIKMTKIVKLRING
jgi:hypothetical protein